MGGTRAPAIAWVVAAFVCFTLLPIWAETAGSPPEKGKDIGAVPIDLDASHLLYSQGMRVFIATDAQSPNCLVTLREANDPFNVRPVFCAPRAVDGQDGVLVSVFFFQDAGPDVVIGLTLYQEGARFYGPLVLYAGD